MNVIVTCRCGNKFRVALERDGQEVRCTACGRTSAISPPATAEEDDVQLQDLHVVHTVQETIAENDGTGFPLDANDGLATLSTVPGMFGTVANIRLDEIAPAIAFGAGGAWALAAQGNDVLIVDMNEHKKIAYFEGHQAEVTSVALSPTDLLALSGDDDGVICFWDLATCKRKKTIHGHRDPINAVALSPDGTLALTGGVDGLVKLWNLATGARRELEYDDWSQDEEVTCVGFARDGTKILAGGSEGRVSMWDVETGRRLQRFDGLELPISCVRLSDEGGIVTATTRPVAFRERSYLIIARWNAKTGKSEKDFHVAVRSIPCCITPDRNGKRVILGGGEADPWMGVFSLENGRCQYDYDHLRGTPICLAVSPHNNRLLASMDTRRLQVFGMESV